MFTDVFTPHFTVFFTLHFTIYSTLLLGERCVKRDVKYWS
jgi:hypothetical protein